jgi:iron complex outermembrane receptor protein
MIHKVSRLTTISALVAAAFSSSAIADTSQEVATKSGTAGVERVEIRGTRQAYRGDFSPLETPQAELILSQELLAQAGALDLSQALDLSTSVARQNNFGGLWNSFAIRGFVGDENLPSNFLVNGFNAGRGFGGPRDLSGIESVEVLKGPRAALFGRGEPGGTINLVTKRPTFEKEGYVKVSAGSFDTYRTDVDYTSPISDSVAVRFVGYYQDAKSFRDTVETKKQGLSPSIAFQFNENSQLTYELEYSDQEIPQDRGVFAFNGQLDIIPESRFLGEPSYGPIELEVLGHQVEYQHDLNENWSALVGFNYRDTSLEGFASENQFFGGRQNFDLGVNDNFDRFTRFRDYDAEYYVFRAEISGRVKVGNLEHRIIVGVDADEFENDQLALRDRSTPQAINVFNPVYGNVPISSLTLPVQIDKVETQESVGVYIQDQISLTDKLDIRLGLRFDDYDQQLIDRRREVGDARRVLEFSESKVSPQLGLVYAVSDELSVYAAYGENFRPLTGATDDGTLDPNESTSAELGIKFSLNDGKFGGTIAVFDVDQSNISTVDENFVATAIGEAGSQGLEIDVNGYITENLSLYFSYSIIDAETENDFNDPNFGSVVPAGSDLLNVPEQQLSLQLVQQMQLAGKNLNLIGGLLYVDDRNGFFSNQDFRLPSYTTVRVAADYELSQSLLLRAEVENLFDKEHYTNSFADVWVQPGTPQNFRVSATYQF